MQQEQCAESTRRHHYVYFKVASLYHQITDEIIEATACLRFLKPHPGKPVAEERDMVISYPVSVLDEAGKLVPLLAMHEHPNSMSGLSVSSEFR